MELYRIFFLCLTVCVHANVYELYSSPCPHLFQYHREGYEWIGFSQVDSLPVGTTMKFEVILSLRAALVTYRHPLNPSINMQYVGSIELYEPRSEAIHRIQLNRTVRYRIRFPSQNPLPKLQLLSVNGNVLCTGPSETGPYVTLIRLEHTLFSDENEHHPDPDSDDDDYKSDAPKLPYTPPQKSRQLQPPLLHTFNQPTNNGLQPNECGTTHAKYNFRHLIVGGENVQRGSWPWLVAIYLRGINELAFSCGGNLISARTVVTAAHCIRTPKGTYSHHDLVLYLGLHNINDRRQTGVQESEVEEIHIHNDFMSKDSSYDADIALIIMPRRLEFTEFIRPICLWDNSDDLSNIQRQLGTVIGWGKDGSGDVLSPEPKRITMPIVSDGECLRSSNTYRYITSDRTYCAGARDGRGPCHGDSGGGMTFKINKRWTLRGIVSAALADPIDNSCDLDEFVVFTDVAKFVNWITSHML